MSHDAHILQHACQKPMHKLLYYCHKQLYTLYSTNLLIVSNPLPCFSKIAYKIIYWTVQSRWRVFYRKTMVDARLGWSGNISGSELFISYFHLKSSLHIISPLVSMQCNGREKLFQSRHALSWATLQYFQYCKGTSDALVCMPDENPFTGACIFPFDAITCMFTYVTKA